MARSLKDSLANVQAKAARPSFADRMRAKGIGPDSLPTNTKLGRMIRGRGVGKSPDLDRILAGPQREERVLTPGEIEAVSCGYRATGSAVLLWEVQARALYELERFHALFGEIAVGEGKTLISFLAPRALEAERPILIVPAGLVDKTIADFAKLVRAGWLRTIDYPIISYEALGRETGARLLEDRAPDLIVADECHRFKNPRAACTRRFLRYVSEHPGTRFVGMSGTPTTRSLRDVAHLYEASHREASPLPLKWGALEEWDLAVAEKIPPDKMRLPPGALERLYTATDHEAARMEPLAAARRAVGRRIRATPGVVVAATEGPSIALEITTYRPSFTKPIAAAFRTLYDDWALPNGELLADGAAVWRHARELALGFFYRWQDGAPREWIDARRAWSKVCRYVLSNNRSAIDSEKQLKSALDAGRYDHPEAAAALAWWRRVEPAFTPITIPEWIDRSIVRGLGYNHATRDAILWVEHTAVGEELARVGVPYYAAGGLDARGDSINNTTPAGGPIAASILACGTGRNLQAWSRAHVLTPPPKGDTWEQLLGRLHRNGQDADCVEFFVRLGCDENEKDLNQARADAEFVQDGSARRQKLNLATWIET